MSESKYLLNEDGEPYTDPYGSLEFSVGSG